MADKLISVAQAAELIGVTPRRVRQLVADGKIESLSFSSRISLVFRDSAMVIRRKINRVGRPRSVKFAPKRKKT